MSLSMHFYESDGVITGDHLRKLKTYFDDKDNPSEVAFLKEEIIEANQKYKIFRLAKKIKGTYQIYKIEEGVITPTEEEGERWESSFVYINENSKKVYVEGSGAGWSVSLISKILFNDETKIKPITIDTQKLEQDIIKNGKFVSIGTGFVDADGTRVKLTNFGGIDLEENRHTKGCESIVKEHVDILIEKDDLELKVLIYPEGKVTFLSYKQDRSVALRIFLKIWDEIKSYS